MTTKTKGTQKPVRKMLSRKTEDKEQYERFRKAARELETDDNPETFDQRVRDIVRRSIMGEKLRP
jgi:hypothetical protein